jgi:hypothetical protein
MGLAVQPREHDLVIGTHGRAAFVIDDIRPLRTVSKELMAKPVHFFEVPDAQSYTTRQKEGARFLGDSEFRGENEPYGALLTYSLSGANLPHPTDEKERLRKEAERTAAQKPAFSETGVPAEMPSDIPKEPEASATDKPQPKPGEPQGTDKPKVDEKATEVDIEVSDASGKVIRKFKGPAVQGLNRTSWDLTRDAFKQPRIGNQPPDTSGGPEVPPGTYTVTLKFRGNEAKQTVRVLPDPRERYTAEQRQAKYNAILRAGALQETATEALDRISRTKTDIDAVNAKLKKDDPKAEPDPLEKTGNALKEKLDAVGKRLRIPPQTPGIVADTDVWSKIGYPIYAMQSSWDAPTEAQLQYLARAEAALRTVLADVNKVFAEDVAKYREQVRAGNLVLLPEEKPLEISQQ